MGIERGSIEAKRGNAGKKEENTRERERERERRGGRGNYRKEATSKEMASIRKLSDRRSHRNRSFRSQ